MPMPKITNGSVSPQLSNVLLAYTNDNFIASGILPTVPNLAKETGKIPVLGTSHLNTYSSKRSLYDESDHRIEFQISNDDSYEIDYYDLDIYIPDRLQGQLDTPFDARNAAQLTVMQSLMLEREVALAAAMTSTSIITQNMVLSSAADKYTSASSNPQEDFDTARDVIFESIGRDANAAYMSRNVANALRRHPWFLEIAQSTLKGGVAKTGALSLSAFIETLKAWYELDYVFIGKSIKITTKEGQTITKDSVWGDDVVFFYRPTAPSLYTPSFGYSFQLKNENLRTVVRRHKNDKGDLVEVTWAYQDKIVDANAAYLIKGAI